MRESRSRVLFCMEFELGDQEKLKELLEYREGKLFWKITRQPVKAGDEAGYVSPLKYGPRHVLHVLGKQRLRSRVIFYYFHGYVPEMVDHEDQNKMNDNIKNLRPATRTQNAYNRNSCKGSSSQYKGVKLKYGKYWEAHIKSNGVAFYLGRFKSEIEAAIAYNQKAILLHGEFANLNTIDSI